MAAQGDSTMASALVCYYSKTGNTEKMAIKIAEALRKNGLEADFKKAEDTDPSDFLKYDCLVFGSPTYYGTMAWPLKKLLDESVKHHGKLKGRVGGAFASSANIAGGNETTVLDILNALLIHGMVVQGEPQGDHYGPVAIGRPDDRSIKACERFAANLAALTKKLFS
jgi:NAD(P)H dehydrogenase (quinone)